MWILTNPHHFLTMYIWDVLNVNANLKKQLLNSVRECLGHVFLVEQLPGWEKASRKKQSPGPTTWKDMPCVDRYCELATKKLEQLYKVSSLCLDDHQFKQEELESVGELSKSFLTHCFEMLVLSTNWTTWHPVGQSTSLRDQSQNGLRLVTDAWQGWFLAFITQTNSDNIVMWETRHSIVDWVCFKTQTLLATL